MNMKKLLIGLVPVVTVLFSAPAYADNQSFIDYVNSHGLQQWTSPGDGGTIVAGQEVCGMMRGGSTPQEIAGMFPLNPNTAAFAEAAQRYLCPDTRR